VALPESETSLTQRPTAGFIGAIALSALLHLVIGYLLLIVLPRYFKAREFVAPTYTVKMVDRLPAGALALRLPALAPTPVPTPFKPRLASTPKASVVPTPVPQVEKPTPKLAAIPSPTTHLTPSPSASASSLAKALPPMLVPTNSPTLKTSSAVQPTPTPAPSKAAEMTPTPSPFAATPTPEPTKIAISSPLVSKSAKPSPSPTPTPTPSPTSTPTPRPPSSSTPQKHLQATPHAKPTALAHAKAETVHPRPSPESRPRSLQTPVTPGKAKKPPERSKARAEATARAEARQPTPQRAEPTPDVKERLEALRQRLLAEHLAEAQRTARSGTPLEGKGTGAGEGSGSAGIQSDPEFIYYYRTIKERIKQSWTFYGGNSELTTVVLFSIDENGNVTSTRIVKSSHDLAFDNSVVRAIRSASPLPPPPEKYRAQFSQGVEAVFKLGELSSQS